MIIRLGEIELFFPKKKIYPEQLQYIKELMEVVQGKGHCLIEMPTGTGKTICILSFLMSYQIHLMSHGQGHLKIKNNIIRNEGIFKIVYCTRTTAELEKALIELKDLHAYVKSYLPGLHYTGIGLSSRKRVCLHAPVKNKKTSHEVNISCREEKLSCPYYEGYLNDQLLPPGVYSLSDLKDICEKQKKCPYYTARAALPLSECIIYTYNYMIDPRISEIVSSSLGSNCVVIFDEAHNIDSACIEALSVKITRNTLDAAWKNICDVERYLKEKNIQKLSLSPPSEGIPSDYSFLLPNHQNTRKRTSITPGSLRTAKGFVSSSKRLIEYFKTKLKTIHLTAESTDTFINSLESTVFIEYSSLIHLSKQLRVVIREIEAQGISEDLSALSKLCDFCSLASQFVKGFSVIFEPFNSFSVYEPVLKLCCLDASIAIKRVFSKYKNVLITSGTLSPISIYPKLLDFSPIKSVEIDTVSRKGLCSLVVTKGSDQMRLSMSSSNAISSGFSLRSEPAVVRNYGNLLLEISGVVPDGLVVFFPSYRYMEEAVSAWTESGVIKKIIERKIIFAESMEHEETEYSLNAYKKACNSGRGAILLSVARGKVSEGVDFSGHYGRAVLVFGVPFQYTESPQLKKRLEFLSESLGVRESEFLSFDAMRHAAQCIGRVLRTTEDYGVAVLADRRFNTPEKRVQLPRWIQRHLEDKHTNLSIDMCISLARNFYRAIASNVYHT
ncbi:DNA excision repair protein ERCC-2 [Nematocida sp. LUAm3]|nr:DNA excision repair protein ERCC-2 [Nematocida sp. LUAm3]KAI5175972.1 DNA excision repair protein ERCC-2 [Nematocida sp. LUAm2]KAI5179068.1 DNA excision repair protein ERCC-2 [Nematocida sp. LUAm1]